MKKTVALVALFALLAVCVIPMADSADATDATTVSAYFYNEGKDLSTATNIDIRIIYSDDGSNGKEVGKTNVIEKKDENGFNKVTITILPETLIAKNMYYFSIYMDGFSAMLFPSSVD